jgi:uncharacterized membrane protein
MEGKGLGGMNKQEFINRLHAALNGRIPAMQVEETVSYYRDYINVEMRKGKSEEEVLEALGDPRLIARTIIQTNGSQTSEGGAQDAEYQSAYGSQWDTGTTYRRFRIPSWLLVILVIVAVICVGSLIFSVLSFLAPVIIVLAAVIFMVKLFRDWLN